MDRAMPGRLPDYGRFQLTALVVLRMLVGWHFLYEGVAKLSNPLWTSAGYLQGSQGWFSGLFKGLANNPGMLSFVDGLNQWGLVAIGLALLLGSFVRVASVSGSGSGPSGTAITVNKAPLPLSPSSVSGTFVPESAMHST